MHMRGQWTVQYATARDNMFIASARGSMLSMRQGSNPRYIGASACVSVTMSLPPAATACLRNVAALLCGAGTRVWSDESWGPVCLLHSC